MARSDAQILADQLLGRPVEDWLRERRDAGISWREIEDELREITKGVVRKRDETLRRWVIDLEAAEADDATSRGRTATKTRKAS